MEVSALLILELKFELYQAGRLGGFQGLDAGVVLPDESLELGRTIRQLGAGLRKDFIGVRLVHVVSLCVAPSVELVSLYEGAGDGVVFLEFEVT